MTQGYLAMVLHAHLPFVRHPEYERFLEEDWLYEAITETYLPLLEVMQGWERDGIPWRLTISLTPPLVSMLRDELLQQRYREHLERLSELVDKELFRTKFQGHLQYLARHYREQMDRSLALWDRYDGDLIRAFAELQNTGRLEVLTCGATHGYLPLMQVNPEAVWAQLKVAADHYEKNFGRPAKGIWLPECGYYEGLDVMVRDAGLRACVMDSHGLLYGEPRPRYGAYAPVYCRNSGVAMFGRDQESSVQVWSSEIGYPGDHVYREFYRDVGYDLDYDYVAPYVQSTGARKNTGIKYHRITGETSHKEYYDPYWAREKAAEHAANFMFNRERQIDHLNGVLGRPPIVVSPYDAELFGHWWYEGPWWLDFVVRKSCYDQGVFNVTHLVDYLREQPTQQLVQPAQSSWGDKGYHEFWLNDTNEWIYPHLHMAAQRMVELARDYVDADGKARRVLNQAARELLLAQSSDWAFIMKTGTMVEYAVRRTQSHLRRFLRLHDELRSSRIDELWLSQVEYLDNIFPDIDYSVYRPL
jgi:1,4-alpha-glucan branching enzyme